MAFIVPWYLSTKPLPLSVYAIFQTQPLSFHFPSISFVTVRLNAEHFSPLVFVLISCHMAIPRAHNRLLTSKFRYSCGWYELPVFSCYLQHEFLQHQSYSVWNQMTDTIYTVTNLSIAFLMVWGFTFLVRSKVLLILIWCRPCNSCCSQFSRLLTTATSISESWYL